MVAHSSEGNNSGGGGVIGQETVAMHVQALTWVTVGASVKKTGGRGLVHNNTPFQKERETKKTPLRYSSSEYC